MMLCTSCPTPMRTAAATRSSSTTGRTSSSPTPWSTAARTTRSAARSTLSTMGTGTRTTPWSISRGRPLDDAAGGKGDAVLHGDGDPHHGVAHLQGGRDVG
uniref:Uncharacterized protein n=1 Tax=Arundo donax TaxID=35708 RepID=A0A0A9APU0_ARUDO